MQVKLLLLLLLLLYTIITMSVQLSHFLALVNAVPTKPVENVVASRVDSERVNISWTPLSYVEARGFPLYNVSYMSCGDQVGSVNTKESSVIIRGLSSHSTYTFTIRVSTGNGTGEATAPGQFHLFVYSF